VEHISRRGTRLGGAFNFDAVKKKVEGTLAAIRREAFAQWSRPTPLAIDSIRRIETLTTSPVVRVFSCSALTYR
jgi:hypothetical protein